jgi:hypothetical protein
VDEDQLRLYRLLSRAPFPRSYVGKVFLSAFLGTHVPLMALLVYFVRRRFAVSGVMRILSVTVPATVVGTALTLWAMHALSKPTTLASRALRRYLQTGGLPTLPVHYTDRAGRLMADAQYTVERLDAGRRAPWRSRPPATISPAPTTVGPPKSASPTTSSGPGAGAERYLWPCSISTGSSP